MADSIKEYDLIRTLVPKNGFPVGCVGVVVDVSPSYRACECEIWNDHAYPMETEDYSFDELEVLSEEEANRIMNWPGKEEDQMPWDSIENRYIHNFIPYIPKRDGSSEEKGKKRGTKDLARLSNLNYLQYTNRYGYKGEFDLPNICCWDDSPLISYLALVGEKREYKPDDCICFYSYDEYFDGKNGLFNNIYYGDEKRLKKFAEKYAGVQYFIAPDYSIHRDAPLIENAYRAYKSRIVSTYLMSELHKIVIPNISFVDEKTKEFALTGISRRSTVCISTKGLMNGRENRKLLDYIVEETLKAIRPACVILYTVTADEKKLEPIIRRIKAYGADCLSPDNLLLNRNRLRMKNKKEETVDDGLAND